MTKKLTVALPLIGFQCPNAIAVTTQLNRSGFSFCLTPYGDALFEELWGKIEPTPDSFSARSCTTLFLTDEDSGELLGYATLPSRHQVNQILEILSSFGADITKDPLYPKTPLMEDAEGAGGLYERMGQTPDFNGLGLA